MNQGESIFLEKAHQGGTTKNRRIIVEGEKKMKEIIGDTRVREEEVIKEIFPHQGEVTRIVLEPPVERLSILVYLNLRREEMEG